MVYPTARQSDDFLVDNPRARVAAVHDAVRDPGIAGVIATVDGWDQLRSLRYLDPSLFREHPTRFFGMSDNTNFQLALFSAGVVSYNGAQLMNEPGIAGELPAYTERYCRRAFFEGVLGELEPSTAWTDEPSTWWSDRSQLDTAPEYEPNPGWRWHRGDGRVSGRLWGGCRAIVEWQLATDRFLPAPERFDAVLVGRVPGRSFVERPRGDRR